MELKLQIQSVLRANIWKRGLEDSLLGTVGSFDCQDLHPKEIHCQLYDTATNQTTR